MNQNALDPDVMSAGARLDELAAILAAGIARLMSRRDDQKPHDSNILREGSLDFSAHESVYGLRTRDDGEGQ